MGVKRFDANYANFREFLRQKDKYFLTTDGHRCTQMGKEQQHNPLSDPCPSVVKILQKVRNWEMAPRRDRSVATNMLV
jgi:hypothetical protein